MITIIFRAVIVALLSVGGIFAFMAKDKKRKGQSGTTVTAGDVKQGRASGLD
jgi:flagellar basal body-associated protein FliL